MVDMESPAQQRLADDHPEILSNITNDPLLSNGLRDDFFNYLDLLEVDGDIEAYIRSYCRTKKLQGPIHTTDQDETLGRVQSLNAMASNIAGCLGLSITAALELLDNLLIDPVLAAQVIDQLAEVPISKGIVWSFLNGPPNQDPFDGEDLGYILCRLGIPKEVPRYIRFGHKLPESISAHCPTAFDASINKHWRPGGLTQPLPDCSHIYEEGLREVVHEPNAIKDISTEIQEL